MDKKECVAVVLAGGQGSRLRVLTGNLAKPAIPFGGKYRIIDFTLSNCYNSRIDTVGVLTQYQPFILNSHIGVGSHWDLDRKCGGVFVLPPFLRENGGEWYKGTANAVYQNIAFIERYDPMYVLVLSADHIYKMDYSLLLEYHKAKGAEATIAVIEVPWGEAGRFGIMHTTVDGKIEFFEEKPKHPKNNLASMGVYVFNWAVLKRCLVEDEADACSSHDFGKDVIPKMLSNGQRLFAYPFSGYWKDVGTVESLWEAHMDLLGDEPRFSLADAQWQIYSENPVHPPHYVTANAVTRQSLISDGCLVLGEVDHSVLFPGVYVGEGASIKNAVIMSNVIIGANARVEQAIIGTGTVVEDGCRIGGGETQGITVIAEKTLVSKNTRIKKHMTADRDLLRDPLQVWEHIPPYFPSSPEKKLGLGSEIAEGR